MIANIEEIPIHPLGEDTSHKNLLQKKKEGRTKIRKVKRKRRSQGSKEEKALPLWITKRKPSRCHSQVQNDKWFLNPGKKSGGIGWRIQKGRNDVLIQEKRGESL